jgi:beta-glucanase (GH16 family)
MNPAGVAARPGIPMKLLPFLAIPLALLAQSPGRKSAAPDPGGYGILTFDDEFNGGQLDLSLWSPHDPWNQTRDRQLQAYTPDSIRLADGQLHLDARRTGKANRVRYDGKDRDYVSGIVSTFGTFSQIYGRFEIRCRVPAGRGLHARFSLMPVPLGPLPEIGVFEVAGSAPARISFANHWGSEQTHRSFGDTFPGPNFSAGFHIVAVEWDPGRIAWFVDGKEMFRSEEGVPHQKMYLLLELAVGGGLGLLPDDSTPLPASFDIDYVRSYQRGVPSPGK